eukprot:7326093-Heterocapsa_arctica.AAC.1
MTYGHVSSTGRSGTKHFSPIQATHRNQVNNNHGDQGKQSRASWLWDSSVLGLITLKKLMRIA